MGCNIWDYSSGLFVLGQTESFSGILNSIGSIGIGTQPCVL